MLIDQVLSTVQGMARTQEAHIAETTRYRERNDRTISAHGESIHKQADALRCIHDYFKDYEARHEPALASIAVMAEFQKKHEPMLSKLAEEEIGRRKFWSDVANKVATSVIYGVIAGIALAAWTGFKMALGLGAK